MSYPQGARIGNIFLVKFLVVVCCCSAVSPEKRAPFCLLIKSEHGSYQVSFLTHSLDTLAPPLFYWSKWTSEKRVEDCFRSTDRTLVTRYLSLCREERAYDNAEKLPFSFNISALLEDARLCEMNSYLNFTLLKEDVNQGQTTDSGAKRRYKRAWVLPGTLWCGRGTNANDYEQLGRSASRLYVPMPSFTLKNSSLLAHKRKPFYCTTFCELLNIRHTKKKG